MLRMRFQNLKYMLGQLGQQANQGLLDVLVLPHPAVSLGLCTSVDLQKITRISGLSTAGSAKSPLTPGSCLGVLGHC